MDSRPSRFAALAAALLTLSAACTAKPPAPGAPSSSPAAAPVSLAIWSNYVTPEVLQDFERRTGARVVVTNFSSNEELLAKLQAGGGGYDVIVPSDYMVKILVALKLLTPLDRARLPHAAGLDPKLMGLGLDPRNEHALPYQWGTTGIAVNRRKFKGAIEGWKDVFGRRELRGKWTLLDDVREGLGAALKLGGRGLNERDPARIADAARRLRGARDEIQAFTSEPMSLLVEGGAWVAHAYSSDALQASARAGGSIEFIIPAEGGTLWIDHLAVPASARNAAGAHALIDYLLDPETIARVVPSIQVATASVAALPRLPAAYRENRAIFPDAATRARLELLEDLGDALPAWERSWTEIKAGG